MEIQDIHEQKIRKIIILNKKIVMEVDISYKNKKKLKKYNVMYIII